MTNKLFTFILALTISIGTLQAQQLIREPYKFVQFIPTALDYHYDGSDLLLFPAYDILAASGEIILSVPEAIGSPHIIQIISGNYHVKVKYPGEVIGLSFEVNESIFQQFRMHHTAS